MTVHVTCLPCHLWRRSCQVPVLSAESISLARSDCEPAGCAAAVVVTGGHGDPVDHLFDGTEHVEISVERHDIAATHGAGCTHSATLAAYLARGQALDVAARGAAKAATEAVKRGLAEIGAGDGPVDVLALEARR